MGTTATTTAIKASELRIDNWVHFTNSLGKEMNIQIDIALLAYMTEADPQYFRHGYGIEYREGSIQGIQLTPEILEACGFVDNQIFHQTITIEYDPVFKVVDVRQWSDGKTETALLPVTIEYLHQLQNLYFALTGEELEINL